MRIAGGFLSGRRLHTPTTRDIRPMRDQVRMALFNIIGTYVDGCRFLDLFAGTGSVGIEAVSRGASECVFVDQLPAALKTLKQNLSDLELLDQTSVIAGDVFNVIAQLEQQDPFDVIFIGPPYYNELAPATMDILAQSKVVAADGLIIAEIFRKEHLGSKYGSLVELDRRLYGDNLLVFYEPQ